MVLKSLKRKKKVFKKGRVNLKQLRKLQKEDKDFENDFGFGRSFKIGFGKGFKKKKLIGWKGKLILFLLLLLSPVLLALFLILGLFIAAIVFGFVFVALLIILFYLLFKRPKFYYMRF